MDVNTSIPIAENAIKEILEDAGFVDGMTQSAQDIKNQTKIMFWRMRVRDKEASSKPHYITFMVDTVEPYKFMDGNIISRKVEIIVTLFTRQRVYPSETVGLMNDAFLNAGYQFELDMTNYDTGADVFIYQFRTGALVSDGEET